MRFVALLALVVGLGGCLRSHTVYCDNGDVCPEGTLCDGVNGGCIVEEQRTVCANVTEPEDCVWSNGVGVCTNGVCLPHVCGDGRRSGAEHCDPLGGDGVATTMCTSVELGFYDGDTATCAPDCTWDVRACSGRCGDAVLNGNELCEVGIAPTTTCVDFGYDRGSLDCGACAPIFTSCGSIGWSPRPMPGKPGRVVAVGAEVFVAIDHALGQHIAARYVGGAWMGLGAFPFTASDGVPEGRAIHAVSASDIWVGGATNAMTGDAGFVARYDGMTWTRVRTFPGIVTAVWRSGAHVFATAGSDLYIHDGTTWTSQALVMNAAGYWISGTSADDVWIGGGRLWHGGASQTFVEVTQPIAGLVSGVSAFGVDRVAVAITNQPNSSSSRFHLAVRDNAAWRTLAYPTLGTKQGDIYARAADDIYVLATETYYSPLPSIVLHHDGAMWAPLTETSLKPTALAGSTERLVAVDATAERAYHYSGAAWVSRVPPTENVGRLAGPRAEQIYAMRLDSFRTTQVFDGFTWGSDTIRGFVDALPASTAIYAVEQGDNGFDNPRLYERGTTGWSEYKLPNVTGTSDIYADWVGVLDTDKVFLNHVVSGLPSYLYWDGNTQGINPVNLTATNLPATESLEHIDCRPSVGCYAGGSTGLWHTPGGPLQWTKIADVDVGPVGAIWVESATLVAIGGTSGRIAHWHGTAWVIHQLPTTAPVTAIVGSSATDGYAVTVSSADEHQLYHWDGTAWTRVRTPVAAFGSAIRHLWTDGRITYFGGGATVPTRHLHSLVRTEPW